MKMASPHALLTDSFLPVGSMDLIYRPPHLLVLILERERIQNKNLKELMPMRRALICTVICIVTVLCKVGFLQAYHHPFSCPALVQMCGQNRRVSLMLNRFLSKMF